MTAFSSIPGIASVLVLAGPKAGSHFSHLVEVPHGADRRADYDALRARMQGELPDGLEAFFHVNTDVGAWALGERIAEKLVLRRPSAKVLLIRCLIPRTFIDANRLADHKSGDPSQGGMTAGIPAYIRDEADRRLLVDLHARYTALTEQAFTEVCGSGGQALMPHTYAPRSIGIGAVGDDIVDQLRWAYEPERFATWPQRPEIDLITRDESGRLLAPVEFETDLVDRLRAAGAQVGLNATYKQHPATQGYRWADRYPDHVGCFEVRRDLLVDKWDPFVEMTADPAKVERWAEPIAEWWSARG